MDASDFLSPKTEEDIEAEYAELPKPYQNLRVADYKERVRKYLEEHAKNSNLEIFQRSKIKQGLIAKVNFGKLILYLEISRDGWAITPNMVYSTILSSYQVLGDKPEDVARLFLDIADQKIAAVIYISDAHKEGITWERSRLLPTISQFYRKVGDSYDLLATQVLNYRVLSGNGFVEKDGVNTIEYDIIHVAVSDITTKEPPKDSTVRLLRENDFSAGPLSGIPIAKHSLDEINKTGHYTVSYESR